MLIDSTNLVQVLDHNDGVVPVATLSGPMGDLTIQGPSGVVYIPSVFTAPLMAVTATSSTTLRTLADRFAQVANVQDFGAKGDGVTNDTTAIQAAANSLVNGGTLFFPRGTYVISTPIAVYSSTSVEGVGKASILSASATWHDPGLYGTAPYVMLTNKNYGVLPIVDKHITVSRLQFTWVNLNRGDAHAVRFNCAQDVAVFDCLFNYGGDAIAFVQCDVGLMTRNVALEHSNCAYDVWGGSTNIRIYKNRSSSTASSQVCNFNGLGNSDLRDVPKTSDGCIIEGNFFEITGGGFATIDVDSLTSGTGTHNTVQNVKIVNNKAIGVMVVGRGNVQNVLVSGNTFANIPAPNGMCQFVSDGTDTPQNIAIQNNTIIGAATASPAVAVVDLRCNGQNIVDGNISISGTFTTNAIDVGSSAAAIGNNQSLTTINGTAYVSQVGSHFLANNTYYRGRATGGESFRFGVDGTNNLRLDSSDSSGAFQSVLSTQMHSTGATLNLYPTVVLAASSANHPNVAGGSTGNSCVLQVSSGSTDTDVYMDVKGKGVRGIRGTSTTKSGAPSTGDLSPGQWGVFKDSGGGAVVLAYNDGGTVKTVALT